MAFHSHDSFIAAVKARFVQLQYGDIDKRVGVVVLSWCKSPITPSNNNHNNTKITPTKTKIIPTQHQQLKQQLQQHKQQQQQVEVKPYVLDDQVCRHCEASTARLAPFFCANVTCLEYFCEACWSMHHNNSDGKAFHKPLVREGTDRPRVLPFKW